MQKKTIRKAYGSLEPEELYRLVVSAAARGDHTECEEIASHCPRVVASIRHPAFDLAVEGTRAMLDAAVPVFAHYLGWLSAIDVVTPSIAQAVDFIIGDRVPAELEEPPSPHEPDEEPPFLALGSGKVVAKRLLGAAAEALAEVCAEHGLDGDEVLRAFLPHLAQALPELLEGIDPAEHPAWAKEQFRATFAQAWTDATE